MSSTANKFALRHDRPPARRELRRAWGGTFPVRDGVRLGLLLNAELQISDGRVTSPVQLDALKFLGRFIEFPQRKPVFGRPHMHGVLQSKRSPARFCCLHANASPTLALIRRHAGTFDRSTEIRRLPTMR